VTVASSGGARRVEADRYVCALPVEQVRMLLSPALRAADPALDRLDHLVTRWMNGIMFYLDTDVRGVRGHTIYIDSEWSLTSVSQQQFWDVDITSMGDGRVEGILSVDISEWNRPGRNGRPAMKCSRQEICDEVWVELEAHLDDDARKELDRANVVTWFLDPAIRFPNPTAATNLEPLLVNTAGSWADRPDAGPAQRARAHARAIGNLYLAADYVRTHTDLATMEGANEAARRAVNEVLDDKGSGDERCDVWPLHEPELFAPARALDLVLFKLGLDPRRPAEITPDGRVDRAGTLEATALAGADLFARLLR
jgi:uncharacterized protein with NAD-binding domain and iron-sulfur cluster